MQLCRVRKSAHYMDCTYNSVYWTWRLYGAHHTWASFEKLSDEFLVPIPANCSTPSV